MNSAFPNLYEIFEHHLHNGDADQEDTQIFIDAVVTAYIAAASPRMIIPLVHAETILEELREEVIEMLQKKMYGHYSLAAFRQHLRTKTA